MTRKEKTDTEIYGVSLIDLDAREFMVLWSHVRLGKHPNLHGDRIYNSDSLLFRFLLNNSPRHCHDVMKYIRENLKELANTFGFPEHRLLWLSNEVAEFWIKRGYSDEGLK